MTAVAHVNGQWLPLAQASVPVLDRGFLLADGVYEVIPAYGGKLFRLPEHLERLDRSLAALRIALPHARPQWVELIRRLVRENLAPANRGDLLAYLQVTRGAPAQRGHPFPADVPPTVVGFCHELPVPSPAARERGVGAITQPDIRWGRCDIKAIALLPNLLAAQAARESGCNETILHRGERVTEGASSNVFVVRDSVVATPPKDTDILPGVTRELLLELLRGAGVSVEERAISLAELRGADEIWITSSTREVLPVVTLDGRPVGAGAPGAMHARAYGLFQDHRRRAVA